MINGYWSLISLKKKRKNKTASFLKNESGNIFFTLFGAVAIVGLLGTVVVSTMRGPLSTMVEVQSRAKAESEMSIGSRMVLLEAAEAANNGDCDGDGFVEPLEWADAGGAGPTGGGFLPATIASSRIDPWGTEYGYCAWDAGAVIDDVSCDDDTSGTYERLDGNGGSADETYTVIAVISAGPDQLFDTTCTGGASPSVSKTGDDIIVEFTYATATAATGGLWNLKSGDPDTAQISKNLEISGGATFTGGIDLTGSSAALQLGAASMLFPDETELTTCNGANDGLIRINTSTNPDSLELCDDPSGWIPIGSGSSMWTAGTGDDIYYNAGTTPQVGIGTTTPGATLDVGGTLDVSGNTDLSGTLDVAGASTLAGTSVTTLGATGAVDFDSTLNVDGSTTLAGTTVTTLGATGAVDFDSTLNVDGNTTLGGTLGVTGATTLSSTLDVTGATSLSSTLDVSGNFDVGSGDFTVDSSNGNTVVGGTLTVAGNISDSTGDVVIDDTLDVNQDANFDGDIIVQGDDSLIPSACTSDDEILHWSTTSGWSCDTLTVDGGSVGTLNLDDLSDVSANTPTTNNCLVYNGTNWVDAACSASGGIWEENASVIRISNSGYYAGTDFVFGSPQLDDDGDANHDARMFFDKSKAAFRAGSVDGTQWNDANVGNYSFATGQYNTASGSHSFSGGYNSQAAGFASFAWGNSAVATGHTNVAIGQNSRTGGGDRSFAFGQDITTTGTNSFGFGLGIASGTSPIVSASDSLGIFMGDQSGYDLSTANRMALVGGDFLIDDDGTTGSQGCVRYDGATSELQYSDDCTTFTSFSSISGTPGGSNTQVQYNDNGTFAGDSGLTFDDVNDRLTVGGSVVIGGTSGNAPTYLNLGDLGDVTISGVSDGECITYDNASSRWVNASCTAGISLSSIQDTDGDTKIQVEEGADDDTIRFDTLGNERMTIGSTGNFVLSGDGTNLNINLNDSSGYPTLSSGATHIKIDDNLIVNQRDITMTDIGNDRNTTIGHLDNSAFRITTSAGAIYLNAAANVGIGNFASDSVDSSLHVQSGDIRLDGGAANEAGCIRFDDTTDKLQFSNDCTTFSDLGSVASGSLYVDDLGDGTTDYSTNHNMYIGEDAGTAITSGQYNLALGEHALNNGATQNRNVGIGYAAIYNNTGGYNTAVGVASMYGTSTASNNSVLGYRIMFAGSGGDNSIVGYQAGYNLDGSYNVIMGSNAGYNATSMANSVLLGYQAGDSITTGQDNTVVGRQSLSAITTQSDNTVVGSEAMRYSSFGARNVAIGRQALGANNANDGVGIGFNAAGASPQNNFVIIGSEAGRYMANSNDNVVIGQAAGLGVSGSTTGVSRSVLIGKSSATAITTGDNNTFIGYQSGDSVTTGSDNILIGYDIDTPTATTSSHLNIGNLIFGDLANEDFIVGSYQLADTGTGTEDSRLFFDKSKGAFRVGLQTGTDWDDANVGNQSIAMGANPMASGAQSVAIGGWGISALADNAMAFGSDSAVTSTNSTTIGHSLGVIGGSYSTAIGNEARVTSSYSMAIGLGNDADSSGGGHPTVSGTNSLGIFMGDNDGYNLSASNRMALVGGDFLIDDAGATGSQGCIRYDGANSKLQFSHDCSTYSDMGNIASGALAINDLSDGYTDYATDYNIYMGNSAGSSSSPGQYNLALGQNALTSLDGTCSNSWECNSNIAIGYDALTANTLGSSNIAIGANTLKTNTTSGNNVAIGNNALTVNTSGDLVAIGSNAMAANTTGSGNLAIGYNSLASNTTGGQIIAIGRNAAGSATTNNWMVAIGNNALSLGGEDSVAIGHSALEDSNSSFNTAVGKNAMRETTSGYSNTAVGFEALDANLDGANNVAIGAGALGSNTSGGSNTALGGGAGGNITTGSSNIMIGRNANAPSATGSNQLNIGNLIYGDLANEDFIVGSYQLDDTATGTEDNRMFFDGSKGAFRAGSVANTQWDDASVGSNSVAFGLDTTSSGAASFAAGRGTSATAGQSVALGYQTTASGQRSFAMGENVNVSGSRSVGFGLSNASGTSPIVSAAGSYAIFMGDQSGYDLSTANRMALVGGDFLIDDAGATGSQGCIRYDGANSKLQFSHDCSTFTDLGSASSMAINDLTDAATDYATDFNMFMGAGAGASITVGGQYNIAIGQNAGDALTTGDRNIALGYNALSAEDEASENVAIGVGVLASNDGGNENTAIGDGAMASNTTGSGNVAIGDDALDANTTGGDNIAIGQNALGANQTGGFNVAIGDNAGTNTTTSGYNTFVGSSAGRSNITGEDNTYIGHLAGNDSTTSSENTAVGLRALENFDNSNSNSRNVALGYSALQGVNAASTGVRNIGLGALAGNSITTGSDNILLGYNVDTPTASTSNHLNIGNLIYGDLSNKDFIVGSYQLDDTATGTEDNRMFFDSSKGAFRAGGTPGAEWDDANVGNLSIALGRSAQASGERSLAFGESAYSNGYASTAIGHQAYASGAYSFAAGRHIRVTANNSAGLGLGAPSGSRPEVSAANSFGIFMGDQSGYDLSTANRMALVGGDFLIDDAGATGSQGCIRYDGTNSKLQFSHDCSTYSDMGGVASGAIAINDLSDAYTDYATNFNMFLGHEGSASLGADNVSNYSFGVNALDSLTNTGSAGNLGDGNIAIGTNALTATTTGWSNTAVGDGAADEITTGGANTAIGALALSDVTSNHRNTGVGYAALSGVNGTQNTALGARSATYLQSGDDNVMIGNDAGRGENTSYNYDGSDNVIIGSGAAIGLDGTNNQNTVIGSAAGATMTGGNSGNILLGYGVDVPTTTTNNHLNIGNAIYGDLTSNHIGIGISTPNDILHIEGSNTFDPIVRIRNTASNGVSGIRYYNNSGAFKGTIGHFNSAYNQTLAMVSNDNDIAFVTGDTGSVAGTIRMMINASNGNIGVGNFASDTIDSVFHLADGEIRLDGGAGNEAGCIRYDDTNDKLQFSHDCSTYADMGTASLSWPLTAPDGTEAAPSYTFANSTGSGLYYTGTNMHMTTTEGSLYFDVDTDNNNGTDRWIWRTPNHTYVNKMTLSGTTLNIGEDQGGDINGLDINGWSGDQGIIITNDFSGDGDAIIKMELTEDTPLITMGLDDSDTDRFKISGGALDTNDRITIETTGEIGIGDFTGDTIDSALHLASGEIRLDGGAANEAGCIRYDDTNDKLQFSHDCSTYIDMPNGGIATALIDTDGDTKIQVEETADEDTIRFDTLGSERMVIDSTGKVGIGIASPTSTMHIVGTTDSTPALTVTGGESASGVGTDITMTAGDSASASTSNGGNIVLTGGRRNNSLGGDRSSITVGGAGWAGVGGYINLNGGIGHNGYAGGNVNILAGAGSVNSNGGNIVIDGGALAGTGADGNILLGTVNNSLVGIGTASPSEPLHVVGTGLFTGCTYINKKDTADLCDGSHHTFATKGSWNNEVIHSSGAVGNSVVVRLTEGNHNTNRVALGFNATTDIGYVKTYTSDLAIEPFTGSGVGIGSNFSDGTDTVESMLHIQSGDIRLDGGEGNEAGCIRFDDTSDKLQFSHDCSTYTDFSAGGGNEIFEVTGTVGTDEVVSQVDASANYATADFVFGSPQLADDGNTDHDARFFFDKSKAAFRAGKANATDWDNSNIGNYSIALGQDSRASGANSVALGFDTNATGNFSFSAGSNTTASGEVSMVIGEWSSASGYSGISFGAATAASGNYSTAIGSSTTASAEESIAFGREVTASGINSMALGLGESSGARRVVSGTNSFGIFMGDQSGYDLATTNRMALIGGDFMIDDAGATGSQGCIRYDGTNSKLQFSDDCSTYSDFSGGSSLWTDNTTHITRGNIHILNTGETTDSIAISDAGGGSGYSGIIYDTDNFALRGGTLQSGNDAWDDANIGANSFVWGQNSQANGQRSMAVGNTNTASGNNAIALGSGNNVSGLDAIGIGSQNTSSGNYSTAFGRATQSTGSASTTTGLSTIASGAASTAMGIDAQATADYSFAIGLGDPAGADPVVSATGSFGIFMGDQSGYNLATTNRMALIGGDFMIDDAGATGSQGCIRYDGTNSKLQFSDDCSTYTDLSSAGADNDWTINAASGYVYNSSDKIGVGTSVPLQDFDVSDLQLDLGTGNCPAGYTEGDWDGEADSADCRMLGAMVDISTGDFMVGTYQQDDIGSSEDNVQLYFDKSKAALRMGRTDGLGWNNSNVGSNSIGLGYNTIASSEAAVAIGSQNTASGSYSLSMGLGSTASSGVAVSIGQGVHATADNAMALGETVTASGINSLGIGLGAASGTRPAVSGASSLGIFMGDRAGYDLSDNNQMTLVGGNFATHKFGYTPTIYLDRSNGTAASPTGLSANDWVGSIVFRGARTDGTLMPAAFISAETSGGEAGQTPMNLIFGASYNHGAGISTYERMRINKDGRVGIGDFRSVTDTIDSRFHIQEGDIRLDGGIGNEAGCLRFDDTSDVLQFSHDCSTFTTMGASTSPFRVNGAAGSEVVNNNNNIAPAVTADFVFGSYQLDSTGNAAENARFFFDKSKAAFRAGSVSSTQWDSANVGNGSFAAGDQVTASGEISAALGASTASAYAAFATGESTASSDYAVAMGESSTSSGYASIAVGETATASGDSSAAFGSNTTASGTYSFTAGEGNTASGNNSVALGSNSTASAFYSFAGGVNTAAAGGSSFAFGNDVTANGEASIALGNDVTAGSGGGVGDYSLAIGLGVATGTKPSVTGNSSVGIFMGDQSGEVVSDANTFSIMGASGGVGIGTVSPDADLHVAGGTVNLIRATSGAGAQRFLVDTSTGDSRLTLYNGAQSSTVQLESGNAGSPGTSYLSNSTLGIGTKTPNANLEVFSANNTTDTILRVTSGVDNSNTARSEIQLREGNSGGYDRGINMYYDGAAGDHFGLEVINSGGTTEALRIVRSNGYIGILNSAPNVALDVNGDIEYTGTITDVSDMRLKDNIEPLNKTGSLLERINQIDTYSFTMKGDEHKRTEFGVMAQDLEKLFPELVHTAKDEIGTKSVNYIGLIAPMIEATKELQAENIALRNEISEIKTAQLQTQDSLNAISEQVALLNKMTGQNVEKASMENYLFLLLGLLGGGICVFFFGRRKA